MPVPFDNEEWFGSYESTRKFERAEEEEDPCVVEDKDVLVSDWT